LGCPTRSSAIPPSCGTRCDLSTRPADTPRRRTGERELIDAHPEQAYLYYNVACCESLAGPTADAVEHLRRAIDIWEGCRGMAKEDSDFDPIRDEPAFQELIGPMQ
jgi:hypothetical protein